MVTESTEGGEVSVTLPPSLDEWLDERAADLGADRETVLVRLLGAYRAAARSADPPATRGDLEALDDRLEGVESDLKGLRGRLLQLRDAVREAPSEDHTHAEFSRFDARVEELSGDVETVAADLETARARLESLESRLDETDRKLTRLARALVAVRERSGGALEDIRRAANRRGVTEADCAACDGTVSVALLTEAACPHCGTAFGGLEPAAAGLRRRFGLRRPELTRETPPEGDGE